MGRILVVDDERSIRNTVKAFLEEDGHQVETSEEAESALAVIQGKPIDVVLTDIILPKLSGVNLLQRIRELSTDVQVIMMTGEPTLETASESLRLGAIDYLQKPVGKNEILKSVRNALRVKCLSDEKKKLEEENSRYLNHLEQLVAERTRALAESEAALRQRAEELMVLNRLARKVNAGMSVDAAIQAGLHEVVHAAAPDLAVAFLLEGEKLVPKGLFPEEAATIWEPTSGHRVGECLCGLAVSQGESIYSTDISTDLRCTLDECRNAGFSSFAALRLKSGSETLGVLGLASKQPRDFSQSVPFLEALANEMSIGLKKNLLYDQLQQHAMELQASITRIKESEDERLMLQAQLQQAQKMEAIGTLASGIAHDFNNILGAVVGYTELAMLASPGDSTSRKHLDMVMVAAHRAKDLVQQILAFSRQSKEERKPISMVRTTKEVLKFIRASLPTTIEIRENLSSDSGNVLADPTQIHQILMNLCTNALHAMRENGGVLRIDLTSVEVGDDNGVCLRDLSPGPYLRLSVSDTGHGIDQQTMARIFDPYFTTKEKGVGTGLGLAVVEGIVRKYGGAIEVESELGKGTKFDVYLPAITLEEPIESITMEEIPGGKERILFIDDELMLADIARQMLECLGYEVEAKTSSVEGLSCFLQSPDRFDLVISDMTMPVMTGDVLAKRVMEAKPEIPVILCTGFSERLSTKQARTLGVKALLFKPFAVQELARVVRSALDGKKDQPADAELFTTLRKGES